MEAGLILSIIIGVGELLKKQGLHPEMIPWINGIIGILTNVFLCGFTLENAGYGFVLGLIASGLYDSTKFCKLFKASKEPTSVVKM
jgi:hypothetical protein